MAFEDLTVRLGLDSSRFTAGLASASGKAATFGTSMQGIGRQMSGVGKTMTAFVTGPIVAMGAGILKVGADFESSMNKVAAVTGASGQELDKLSAQAQELGRTTRFSASEAADAMSFLGMAGFETTEIMSAMPGVLDLAAAGNMEIAETADIASNILSGFGLEAEEMTRVSDVMAATMTNSNTNISQLGEAMSYVAPVASAMGISIEETSAAIGLMSDNGIQGSRAGTALRTALTRLANPTDQVAEKLAEYGIALEDVNPETNSLAEIMGVLEDAGISAGDMIEIFGQRAGPGMQALISEGADSLEDFTGELENSDGTAKRVADTMEEGLAGSLRRLRSALEGVGIAIYESGMDTFFTRMIDRLAGFFSRLAEVNPAILQLGVVVAGAVAAIGPFLWILGSLITAAGTVLTTFTPIVSFLFGPWGLAIAAAIAAGVLLYQNWDVIRERLAPLGEALQGAWEAFQNLGRYIGEVVSSGDTLNDYLDELPEWMQPAAEAVGDLVNGFRDFRDTLQEGISGRLEDLGFEGETLQDQWGELGSFVGGWFLDRFRDLGNLLADGILGGLSALVTASENLIEGLAPLAHFIGEVVVSAASNLASSLASVWDQLVKDEPSVLRERLNELGETLGINVRESGWLRENIDRLLDRFYGEDVESTAFVQGLNTLGERLGISVREGGWLADNLQRISDRFHGEDVESSPFVEGLNTLGERLGINVERGGWLADNLDRIWDRLNGEDVESTPFISGLNTLGERLGINVEQGGWLADALERVRDWFHDLGIEGETLAEQLVSLGEVIQEWVLDKWQAFRDRASELWEALEPLVGPFWDDLVEGLADSAEQLGIFWDAISPMVGGALRNWAGDLGAFVRWLGRLFGLLTDDDNTEAMDGWVLALEASGDAADDGAGALDGWERSAREAGDTAEEQKSTWEEFIQLLKDIRDWAIWVEGGLNRMSAASESAGRDTRESLLPALEAVPEMLREMGAGFMRAADLITGPFVEAYRIVTDTLSDVETAFEGFISWLGGLGDRIFGPIAEPFERAYNWIVGNSLVPDLANEVVRILTELPGRIVTALSEMPGDFSRLFGEARDLALARLAELRDDAIQLAQDLWGGVTTWWDDLVSDTGRFFGDLYDSVSTWMGDTLDSAVEFAQGLWDGVTGWWDGLLSDTGTFFSDIYDAVATWMSDTAGAAIETAEGLWDDVTGWWDSLFSDSDSIYSDIYDSITTWISETASSVVDTATGLYNDTIELWETLSGATLEWFEQIGANMVNPISEAWDTLKGIWNEIIDGIADVLDAIPGLGSVAEMVRGARFARGGTAGGGRIQAFAEGGTGGFSGPRQPRTHLWGEGSYPEAFVTADPSVRKQNQGYAAKAAELVGGTFVPDREFARGGVAERPLREDSFAQRKLTHRRNMGRQEGFGPTMHTLIPELRTIAESVARTHGTPWNTYSNHPPGATNQPYWRERSVDWWGSGGRGDPIGDAWRGVASDASAQIGGNMEYILTPANDPAGHWDHIHVSAFIGTPGSAQADDPGAYGGGAGGGGSGGPNPLIQRLRDLWQEHATDRIEGMDLGTHVLGEGLKGIASNASEGLLEAGISLLPAWIGGGEGAGGPGLNFDGGGTPNENRALGQQMNEAMGWGSHWSALDNLWTRESGWNQYAANPTSDAYGIPQGMMGPGGHSPPPGYMPPESDPAVQIDWGLGYIGGRYGNPGGAWSHFQANNWYDKGGVIPGPLGDERMVLAHAGERVLPTNMAGAFDRLAESIEVWSSRSSETPDSDGDLYEEIRKLREDVQAVDEHLDHIGLDRRTVRDVGHENVKAAAAYQHTDAYKEAQDRQMADSLDFLNRMAGEVQ